jgi:hypothetical protein
MSTTVGAVLGVPRHACVVISSVNKLRELRRRGRKVRRGRHGKTRPDAGGTEAERRRGKAAGEWRG